MKIVIIPHWVQEIANRNGLTKADYLDFDKMRPLMSLADIVSWVAAQSMTGYLFGKDKSQGAVMTATAADDPSCYGAETGQLFNIWCDRYTSGGANKEKLDYLYNTVGSLAADLSVKQEVFNRLYSEAAKSNEHEDAFNVYDLTPAVAGVVVYPGFFVGAQSAELQAQLAAEVLKTWYAYSEDHEVAATPLFGQYLNNLAM